MATKTPRQSKRYDDKGCFHDYGKMPDYMLKILKIKKELGASSVRCHRCGKVLVKDKNA